MNRYRLLILSLLPLLDPLAMLAQRGGGHRGESRPFICLHSCEAANGTGDDGSGDDAPGFARILALQASDDQSSALAKVVRDADEAALYLQNLRDLLHAQPEPSAVTSSAVTLDHAVEGARAANQNFLASLSETQKSGLKETIRKLAAADTELGKASRLLGEAGTSYADRQLVDCLTAIGKALAGFQKEQFNLAGDMGVVLSSSHQELTFNLPAARTTIDFDGESVLLSTSASLTRTSAAGGQDFFDVHLEAGLSDVQHSATEILKAKVSRAPACGEWVQVREAVLAPDPPASLLTAHIHFERWFCPPGTGTGGAIEHMSDDATVVIKFTAAVQQGSLRLLPELVRVDANDALREPLQHGSLGQSLRDQSAEAFLFLLRQGIDLNEFLSPEARKQVALKQAHFAGTLEGQISLEIEGQLQLSDAQTQQVASQLPQRLSAQQAPPR